MKERLVQAGALVFGLWLMNNAFSKQTRQQIGERDGWACTVCGKKFCEGHMVHAAHDNHDKRNPNYDDPNMGKILCVPHHLQQHKEHVGRAQKIGLTEQQNLWAIQQLLNTEPMTHEYLAKNAQASGLRQMSLDELNDALFG
jgi:hypothetical protein